MWQQYFGLSVRRPSKIRTSYAKSLHKISIPHEHQSIQLEWNLRNSTTDSKKQPSVTMTQTKKVTSPGKKIYVPSPSPPALEPKEQREFISLLRKSNPASTSSSSTTTSATHPDLVDTKGPVEFEGDVNPSTGEVNGPKRDPLRWPNEWGYGGRATDF